MKQELTWKLIPAFLRQYVLGFLKPSPDLHLAFGSDMAAHPAWYIRTCARLGRVGELTENGGRLLKLPLLRGVRTTVAEEAVRNGATEAVKCLLNSVDPIPREAGVVAVTKRYKAIVDLLVPANKVKLDTTICYHIFSMGWDVSAEDAIVEAIRSNDSERVTLRERCQLIAQAVLRCSVDVAGRILDKLLEPSLPAFNTLVILKCAALRNDPGVTKRVLEAFGECEILKRLEGSTHEDIEFTLNTARVKGCDDVYNALIGFAPESYVPPKVWAGTGPGKRSRK